MNCLIFNDAESAVQKIAKEFVEYSLQNRPVHISLSGGSTPSYCLKL